MNLPFLMAATETGAEAEAEALVGVGAGTELARFRAQWRDMTICQSQARWQTHMHTGINS